MNMKILVQPGQEDQCCAWVMLWYSATSSVAKDGILFAYLVTRPNLPRVILVNVVNPVNS